MKWKEVCDKFYRIDDFSFLVYLFQNLFGYPIGSPIYTDALVKCLPGGSVGEIVHL